MQAMLRTAIWIWLRSRQAGVVIEGGAFHEGGSGGVAGVIAQEASDEMQVLKDCAIIAALLHVPGLVVENFLNRALVSAVKAQRPAGQTLVHD